MLVPMHLSRILIREMADMQVIELSETGGTRKFPIVIGLPEAFAIDRRIKGVQIPRPQTHDLLAETIRALGGTLKAIHIHDLDSGTFFAKGAAAFRFHRLICNFPSRSANSTRQRLSSQCSGKTSHSCPEFNPTASRTCSTFHIATSENVRRSQKSSQ